MCPSRSVSGWGCFHTGVCVCVFISFQEYMQYIVVHAYVEVCMRVSLCVCFILFIFAVSETGPRTLCKLRNDSTSELHASLTCPSTAKLA